MTYHVRKLIVQIYWMESKSICKKLKMNEDLVTKEFI